MFLSELLLPVFVTMAATAVCVAVAAYWLERVGLGPTRIMPVREWGIMLKLIGIILIAILLYGSAVTQQLPAALFIYGRF